MLALIPLIVSLVPELARLLGGDTAGKIASSVTSIFQQVTGTTDPAKAEQIAKENPRIRAQLQIRLNELVVEMQRIELQSYQAQLADIASARAATVSLAQAKSPIAWGAPIVSVIVVLGYFSAFAAILLVDRNLDPSTRQIFYGSLIGAFTTVVSYYLGGSRRSVEQDAMIHASTASAINTLDKVATNASQAPSPVVIAPPISAPEPVPARPDNFARCIAIVFAQEGGFVDNPNDPGRATNMGITLATLSDWRNRPCTADDVRSLTKQEATEIYRTNYWNYMRCGDLPGGLDLLVFDMGVHAGQRTSVKILQRVTGVTDDGSVGPRTLEAVAKFPLRDLIAKFSDARLPYYQSLSGWATFGKGWARRVAQVRSAAEAMVG